MGCCECWVFHCINSGFYTIIISKSLYPAKALVDFLHAFGNIGWTHLWLLTFKKPFCKSLEWIAWDQKNGSSDYCGSSNNNDKRLFWLSFSISYFDGLVQDSAISISKALGIWYHCLLRHYWCFHLQMASGSLLVGLVVKGWGMVIKRIMKVWKNSDHYLPLSHHRRAHGALERRWTHSYK